MGLLAIVFVIVSLIFRDIVQIRFFHLAVCVLTPIHLFSFFTYQLKLFSNRLWLRRLIVIAFSVCVILTVNILFGSLRFTLDSMILYSCAVVLFILLTIFVYVIADKIEKRNLELINQKLETKNENKT